jgi:hypothetical protein
MVMMVTFSTRLRAQRQDTCNDPMIGTILSGWRYDISGVLPELRVDYEAHLRTCAHCRDRQRLHRTIDLLLLAVTTLSFAAFLLAALVMHRLEAIGHLGTAVHVHLHEDRILTLARIPDSIAISLEAVAIAGMFISMILWTLVTIATPIPNMVGTIYRERIYPGVRDRLHKQEA